MPTLTPAERRELRLQMLMALLGGGLWLSVLVALVWLLRGRLALPAPLDRGQAWLLLPLLLWWLWLLRRQPRRLLLLWRDLRAGQALTVRGTSTVLPHRGIGWLAPVRLRLAVADRLFAADRFALADLLPGQPVQARYAPQSSTLLAVAPWPMPAAVAVGPGAVESKGGHGEFRAWQRRYRSRVRRAGQAGRCRSMSIDSQHTAPTCRDHRFGAARDSELAEDR